MSAWKVTSRNWETDTLAELQAFGTRQAVRLGDRAFNHADKIFYYCSAVSVSASSWLAVGGGGGGGGGTPRLDLIPGEIITGDAALSTPLSFAPLADSATLYLNGQELREGSGNDYTISGTTITWLVATGTAVPLDTSDVIDVQYES